MSRRIRCPEPCQTRVPHVLADADAFARLDELPVQVSCAFRQTPLHCFACTNTLQTGDHMSFACTGFGQYFEPLVCVKRAFELPQSLRQRGGICLSFQCGDCDGPCHKHWRWMLSQAPIGKSEVNFWACLCQLQRRPLAT